MIPPVPPSRPSDPADPLARESQTFPRLPAEMLDVMRRYGAPEHVPDGAVLFERGQRGADFFVVLEGEVAVTEHAPDGADRVITTHRAGQFSGEMDLFNDRAILVSARAVGDAQILRIKRDDFRRMIAAEPDISELLVRAFILRRVAFIQHAVAGVLLVGPFHAGDTQRLARFMTRNAYPHRLVDTETEADVGALLEQLHVAAADLPVLIMPGGTMLRNPSTAALADALGLTEALDPDTVYDVAVVGAGPAGLAAAVYAASEGLSTIVLEETAPGGQAGTSSKIENYLGFPTGISGQALAGRAQSQAQKFGARLAIARTVERLHCDETPFRLDLEHDLSVRAAAIVIATGARYRKLRLADYERFEGQGVHYAATALEARLCGGEEVAVVGGGNSAGQATMFLTRFVRHVHVLVRGPDLSATMSDYLIRRIKNSACVTVHPFAEVTALEGERLLQRLTWTDRRTGQSETREIGNLFVMIGAEPNTEWLDGCLRLDNKGFVLTGKSKDGQALPSPFMTSRTGVFAVGDVRAGSVKRVASSVGEGSVVVQAIHEYLHST